MATDQLDQHALQEARLIDIDPSLVKAGILARRKGRKYIVETEHVEGGSFYRPALEGPSTILYINRAHPFFTEVYFAEGTDKEHRAKIEVFLWAFAVAELEAEQEEAHRYVIERGIWSAQLRVSLPLLAEIFEA